MFCITFEWALNRNILQNDAICIFMEGQYHQKLPKLEQFVNLISYRTSETKSSLICHYHRDWSKGFESSKVTSAVHINVFWLLSETKKVPLNFIQHLFCVRKQSGILGIKGVV